MRGKTHLQHLQKEVSLINSVYTIFVEILTKWIQVIAEKLLWQQKNFEDCLTDSVFTQSKGFWWCTTITRTIIVDPAHSLQIFPNHAFRCMGKKVPFPFGLLDRAGPVTKLTLSNGSSRVWTFLPLHLMM
jgi:hypothetical protein